jgi:elongator complex protein 2
MFTYGFGRKIMFVYSLPFFLPLLDLHISQFVHSATLSGHEDWVRCLDFHQTAEDQPLVLASGSQDGNIRLWNVEPFESPAKQTSSDLSDDLLDAFEASLNELGEGEEGGKQISLRRHILTVKMGERYVDAV